MNDPPDTNMNQSSDDEQNLTIGDGASASGNLLTSIEEPTYPSQMVTDMEFNDDEQVAYQQIERLVAINANQHNVTFSQTEPLILDPNFGSNPPVNHIIHRAYTGDRLLIVIIILIAVVVHVDPAVDNTPLVVEDREAENVVIPVDLNTQDFIMHDTITNPAISNEPNGRAVLEGNPAVNAYTANAPDSQDDIRSNHSSDAKETELNVPVPIAQVAINSRPVDLNKDESNEKNVA